jgi:hypothetical protein
MCQCATAKDWGVRDHRPSNAEPGTDQRTANSVKDDFDRRSGWFREDSQVYCGSLISKV